MPKACCSWKICLLPIILLGVGGVLIYTPEGGWSTAFTPFFFLLPCVLMCFLPHCFGERKHRRKPPKGGLLMLAIALVPLIVSANGGMQKVTEGRYIVNVSAAPIAPYVGEEQSLLIGFADIEGNLLEEDIDVDLSLHYQNEPLFERSNFTAENSVLPFSYTYEDPGIYELFVRFRLPSDPERTYMPEDFLIEVKPRHVQVVPLLFLGGLIGFLLGSLISKRH